MHAYICIYTCVCVSVYIICVHACMCLCTSDAYVPTKLFLFSIIYKLVFIPLPNAHICKYTHMLPPRTHTYMCFCIKYKHWHTIVFTLCKNTYTYTVFFCNKDLCNHTLSEFTHTRAHACACKHVLACMYFA